MDITGLLSIGAKTIGRGLLGAGTAVDATPEARAYKLYLAEQQSQGLPAVSQAEFNQGKR